MPHLGQNPSARPGRSPRDRPTGSPQLLQKRLFSATTGSDMIAEAGSRYGTRGTSTRPAPSIPRRREEDRDEPVRTLRLDVLPVIPVGPVTPVPRPVDPVTPVPRPAVPADADRAAADPPAVWAGVAPAAGASPQTSQYPSTIVPPHPGRAQRSSGAAAGGGTAAARDAAGAAAGAGAAAAMPQTSQ
ncbi:hypothetical protein GCM10010151_46790 [Actinoallomurus spadix]|uniref:Uncharacterized protein n=1 Tax=Actinoallomurus spadix TaxID=79912 RepID=A0ABP3GU71_9ACTN